MTAHVRESPADLSTTAIGSGSRPALTQPMGRFAYRRLARFDAGYGRSSSTPVASKFDPTTGRIVRQFAFDDNASRRAINGKINKKQAFHSAKTFAGKGHTIVTTRSAPLN
jgi:hypothetical protein